MSKRKWNKRRIAREVALSWLNIPYVWGGEDFAGQDCSGFAKDPFQAVGLFPWGVDVTAQGMMEHYRQHGCQVDGPGELRLVFWGDNGRASHVAICLDEESCIEAGGGGSGNKVQAEDRARWPTWTTEQILREKAMKNDAFIKVRPIAREREVLAYMDPFLLLS